MINSNNQKKVIYINIIVLFLNIIFKIYNYKRITAVKVECS